MKQDEAFRKNLAKKLRGAYETDERLDAVNTQGLAACGMLAILYVIVRIIYVGVHGGLALPELVLLFLMGLAIWKVNRQHKVHKLPTVFGKVVDPSPKARGKRLGLYTLNGAALALTWSLMDLFGDITGQGMCVRQFAIAFMMTLVISFLMDLVISERKIQKYNAYIVRLEAEENDLS